MLLIHVVTLISLERSRSYVYCDDSGQGHQVYTLLFSVSLMFQRKVMGIGLKVKVTSYILLLTVSLMFQGRVEAVR